MTVKKYKSKPKTIEAIEYTGENQAEIEHFIGHALARMTKPARLQIPNLEGVITAYKGDFIIKGLQKGLENEFYPVKPYIFHKSYEL